MKAKLTKSKAKRGNLLFCNTRFKRMMHRHFYRICPPEWIVTPYLIMNWPQVWWGRTMQRAEA